MTLPWLVIMATVVVAVIIVINVIIRLTGDG
jgi:hypothetical protein